MQPSCGVTIVMFIMWKHQQKLILVLKRSFKVHTNTNGQSHTDRPCTHWQGIHGAPLPGPYQHFISQNPKPVICHQHLSFFNTFIVNILNKTKETAPTTTKMAYSLLFAFPLYCSRSESFQNQRWENLTSALLCALLFLQWMFMESWLLWRLLIHSEAVSNFL